MKRLLAIALLGIFAAGCGASRPAWVSKGSGAFKKEQKMLYGVGVAEGIQSEALRRETADNRALAQISKQLTALSTTLMRDYMAHTSASGEQKASEEQYIENTAKTFTSNVVSGVKIVDRYQEKNGTLYSLASVSLDEVKAMTSQMKSLSEEMRAAVQQNAEKAFDKLAEEEAKKAGSY